MDPIATGRAPKVKNKAPAPVQITAEQIIREAHERRPEVDHAKRVDANAVPQVYDEEELREFQGRRRKHFEDNLRRNRQRIPMWIQYAAFEESQSEIQRARSVFERALEVDPRSSQLYLKYLEMEMRHKSVNHARNLFDRVVSLLPRVDQFWLKYTCMEELLGNPSGARAVFERWMRWQPGETAWMAYVKFEERWAEPDRAREIWTRFLEVHPDVKNWLKWARYEERHGNLAEARAVYQRAIETLGQDFADPKVFSAFAKFEISHQEIERARVILRFALDRLPKSKSLALREYYDSFERRFGDRSTVESLVTDKRRKSYRNRLALDPFDYDVWFDLAKLEEAYSTDVDSESRTRVREVYERAVARAPPVQEKRAWRRYIWLWINYALFEELDVGDLERAAQVYAECLRTIPHRHFTFAKVWLEAARLELRRGDLVSARRILGRALGLCPKPRVFRGYIELELALREFDRVRILYRKFLEHCPSSAVTWSRFAEFEVMLGELERARAIFEIAVSQDSLDMPEVIWKAWIDLEASEGRRAAVRSVYERLLERTEHVKVWIAYASFELHFAVDTSDETLPSAKGLERARAILQRGYESARTRNVDEDRVALLEAWLEIERGHGDEEAVAKVEARFPRLARKRRATADGDWEEYVEHVFPDDDASRGALRLLDVARQWKLQSGEKAA